MIFKLARTCIHNVARVRVLPIRQRGNTEIRRRIETRISQVKRIDLLA